MLKKYGAENPQQNKKIREKTKNTCIEKYGTDNPSKNKNVINKIKETFNVNYGFDNCFQNDEIKNKIIKTNFIKYGGHPSKTDEVKEKNKNTCLKRFGCISYAQTDEYKISQGIILDKDIKDDFKLYKRKSRRIFDKIKYKVFENWEGYDYYDNEYIKNNLYLSFKDRNYPTIDHKISIYYGFINNINVEEINKLENLVITKRCNNSSKGTSNK